MEDGQRNGSVVEDGDAFFEAGQLGGGENGAGAPGDELVASEREEQIPAEGL